MKDIMGGMKERSGTIGNPNGKTVVASQGQIKKISEHLDSEGNVIDPLTKRIIKRARDL